MSKILVIDDESLMREFIAESLTSQGYEVDSANNGMKALEIMNDETYDLVLTDYKMPKVTGMDVLRKALEKMPDCKVVIMTAYGTIEKAVEAMKIGAFDYITKPFGVEEILHLVKRALEFKTLQVENRLMQSELEEKYGYRNIIGESPAMKKVFDLIETVSQSKSTVLLTGKSGTGKELAARAIHYLSPRKDGPFEKINCAALPSELMESELFGHEKGSFTGASKRYHGRFERANGGTLFLDEISEMSQILQAKLLRVLQEKEFEPVGSSETIEVDVRIITTTNRDIESEVNNGNFREDLYYRLNVISIHLPLLRERIGDVPLLAEHFLNKYNRENGKAIEGVSDEVLESWKKYEWPGNVRELENTVERAVVMCKGKILEMSDVVQHRRDISKISGGTTGKSENGSAVTIAEMERELILRTLEAQGGNRTTTAEILDISVRTLRNKLAQYGEMDAFK
ncbi:sigma-54-dependent transcriptional regulator [Candidatus Latescibacterota bacterium]